MIVCYQYNAYGYSYPIKGEVVFKPPSLLFNGSSFMMGFGHTMNAHFYPICAWRIKDKK